MKCSRFSEVVRFYRTTSFVAQELKEIFPTAVTELSIEEDEESVLIVDYDQVTAINSGAIKEQQQYIKKLERMTPLWLHLHA